MTTLSHKPAGLRTHLLVSASAAFLLGLSEGFLEYFQSLTNPEIIQADPARIVQAIVTGISFLGAGTIFKYPGKDHIEGLTTAASMLFCAIIGMSVALGYYLSSVVLTIAVVLVLILSRVLPETIELGRRNG